VVIFLPLIIRKTGYTSLKILSLMEFFQRQFLTGWYYSKTLNRERLAVEASVVAWSTK